MRTNDKQIAVLTYTAAMGTPHHPTPHRPLPLRDGVDPVCFRLPQHLPPEWEGRPAVDILLERFDRSRDCLAAQLAAGTIVDDDGHRITSHTPARGGLALWSYRPLPASEPTVPLTMPVLYRDDDILVIDKPHFLPTIPRGRYVTHTALVQLRRQLAAAGDTEAAALITPAHRLDRLTAGVLLFTVRKEVRGLYQTLFTRGLTHKTYFAIAPLPQPPFSSSPPVSSYPAARSHSSSLRPHPARQQDAALPLLDGQPVEVHSRIVVSRNRLDCYEEPGEPNAHTTVELVDSRGAYGLYRLTPHTGKTHQLRVHMNSLGLGLVGDPLYPVVLDDGPDHPEDPQRTLQLLSAELNFPQPHQTSNAARCTYRSKRTLQWPDGTPTIQFHY